MDKEMKPLMALIREACDSWRGYKRDLESAMEIGHGRLEELFNGHTELKVRHLIGLARLLKVRPSDFLRLGFPGPEDAAPSRLEEWIGEPQPPKARRKAQPLTPEHEARIRELIREELGKSGA